MAACQTSSGFIIAGVEQVKGAETLLLTVEEAQMRWDDLAAPEAVIFGAPTSMAGASAQFKAFQDATSHAVIREVSQKMWRLSLSTERLSVVMLEHIMKYVRF